VVGYRRLRCGIDRMSEVNELDGRVHADSLCQGGRLAHQKLRHRQRVHFIDVDRFAMVFTDTDIAETELVREYDFGQILFVSC
jgi:hypothetical protein